MTSVGMNLPPAPPDRGTDPAPMRNEDSALPRFEAWLEAGIGAHSAGALSPLSTTNTAVPSVGVAGMDVPATLYEWAALAQYALSQVGTSSSLPAEALGAVSLSQAGHAFERSIPVERTPIEAPSAPQHYPLTEPAVLQPLMISDALPHAGDGVCVTQPVRMRSATPVSVAMPGRRSIIGGADESGSWWWIRDYAASDGELQQIAWKLARAAYGPVNVMINGQSAYTFISSSSGEPA